MSETPWYGEQRFRASSLGSRRDPNARAVEDLKTGRVLVWIDDRPQPQDVSDLPVEDGLDELLRYANFGAANGAPHADPDPFLAYRGNCRSCGAAVYWATTEKGKPMPVDPEPVENGNIVLVKTPSLLGETQLTAAYLKQGQGASGSDRRVSHFASCPEARSSRRG